MIPQQWTQRRLRFDARLNPVKSELDFVGDADVSFVPMDAVGELGGLRLDEERAVDEVYNGYTYFRDGDVVIAKITPCFENGKGAIAEGLTNGVGFGTTELHVVRPGRGLDDRFLFYVTLANDFRSLGEAEMLGAGGQKRVPERFLKDWRPPLPSLETQKRIAAFLDEKTARIDALIAKKQALLKRLAEKRQAIITQAVTKGLNPAAVMKDSGIDWLGQIPAHWDVRRIKEIGTLIGGAGFPHEFQGFTDLELPFFKVMDLGQVTQNQLLLETTNTIDRPTARSLGASIIQAGDIVFAKVGAALLLNRFRKIGRDCCIDNNMMAFRPSSLIDGEFALQALSRIKFADIVNPGAVPSINGKQIGEICVARPPMDEQAAITAFILSRSADLEYAETRVAESVDRLAEYRSALITSAVTGQIEELQ